MKKMLALTDAQRILLKELSQKKGREWRYYKRLEAVRLCDQGLSVAVIASRLCLNKQRIYEYIKLFEIGEFSALLELQTPKKESLLSESMLSALERFVSHQKEGNKRCTPEEMAQWLHAQYHVAISPRWIYKRMLMRRNARFEQL